MACRHINMGGNAASVSGRGPEALVHQVSMRFSEYEASQLAVGDCMLVLGDGKLVMHVDVLLLQDHLGVGLQSAMQTACFQPAW